VHVKVQAGLDRVEIEVEPEVVAALDSDGEVTRRVPLVAGVYVHGTDAGKQPQVAVECEAVDSAGALVLSDDVGVEVQGREGAQSAAEMDMPVQVEVQSA